jgi:SAM-dependent methyltransferase
VSKQLHGTPIDFEPNLLDQFSSKDRFGFFYNNFIASEKSYVEDKIANAISHGRVLNVGCGRHGTERTLFPRPQYEIVGVDVSEESLRILNDKKLYDALFKASICSLPFASESFDIVYLRLVLHHLVYPLNILAPGLEECFRVLRRGGILALVEPNSWHPIGALMNIAHMLGIDRHIHGTDDDIALSPLMLRRYLLQFSSNTSTHVVTYSWRRLPIPLQTLINRLDRGLKSIAARAPYFGHTLMMIGQKR